MFLGGAVFGMCIILALAEGMLMGYFLATFGIILSACSVIVLKGEQ
jgi:hypothetical protein